MIDIYQRGGRNISTEPLRGDGKLNPDKSNLITGFSLSGEEKTQLIDFLMALTDSSVLVNPAFKILSQQTNDYFGYINSPW